MSEHLNISGSVFLLGDDVNTDIHCSNKYLPGRDVAFVAQHAFEQLSPGLARQIAFEQGGILVAGAHFGMNSSREQATQVLHQMKVRAIVAQSFGRQFFRNAINNGMPVFECDTSMLQSGQAVELDLAQGVLSSQGRVLQQTYPLPPEMLAILSMGGLIPFLQAYPDWNFAR